MKKSHLLKSRLLFTAALFALCAQANAAIVLYSGADTAAATPAQLINSNAAAAAFAAATPGAATITFDTALPAGVTVTGGSTDTQCLFPAGNLWGFNTTSGGSSFRCLVGQSVTFVFATPIDAFGLYITGLQSGDISETLTFSDGSNQTFAPPSISTGGAFLGFTDFGKQITSVTYNAGRDAIGLDDVRFHTAQSTAVAVPEPATIWLFGAALIGAGVARGRTRR